MELTADRVDIAEERTLQVRHDKKLHTFEGNQQEHFSFLHVANSIADSQAAEQDGGPNHGLNRGEPGKNSVAAPGDAQYHGSKIT